VSANVLKTLDRASRTSSVFDKLVKPIQLPAVALN
jgi:hypothetical protein